MGKKKGNKKKRPTGTGPEGSIPRQSSLQVDSDDDDSVTSNPEGSSTQAQTEEKLDHHSSTKEEIAHTPEQSPEQPVVSLTEQEQPTDPVEEAEKEVVSIEQPISEPETVSIEQPASESEAAPVTQEEPEAIPVTQKVPVLASPPSHSPPPVLISEVKNHDSLMPTPDPESPAITQAHSPLFSQDQPQSIFDHVISMIAGATAIGAELVNQEELSQGDVSNFIQKSRDILVQVSFMEKTHSAARNSQPLKACKKTVEESISMLKTRGEKEFVEGLVLNLKVLHTMLKGASTTEPPAPEEPKKVVVEETPSAKTEKGHSSAPTEGLSTGTSEIVPEIVIDRGSPVKIVSTEKSEDKPIQDEDEDDGEVQTTFDFSQFSKEELVEKMTQLSKNRDDMFQHLIGRKSSEKENTEAAEEVERLKKELATSNALVKTLQDAEKDLNREKETLEMEVSILKKSNKKLEESRAAAITMAILDHEDPEQSANLMELLDNHRPSVSFSNLLAFLDDLLSRNITLLSAEDALRDVKTLNSLLEKNRVKIAPYRDALGKVEEVLIAGVEAADNLKLVESTVKSQQTRIEELERDLKAAKRSSRLISSEPFLAKPLSADTEAPPAVTPEVDAEESEEDDEDALIHKTMALLKNEMDTIPPLDVPVRDYSYVSSEASSQDSFQKPVHIPKTPVISMTISDEDRPKFEKAAVIIQKRMRGILARKLYKAEIVKKHITKEILDTEETFVTQLKHLVLDYMAALGKRQGKESPISQELWSDLFGMVPGVLEYNSELVKQIRVRIKDKWHYQQKIGDVFVDASSKLANYTNYVNNYHRALAALHQCQKNANFVALCQETCNSTKMRLTLGDLLIIPIQRIPRYVLLLEQIYKKTKKDHPDYEDLGKAIQLLKETAAEINKKKGESMKFQEIIDLQQKITNYPMQKLGDLANPDRVMLFDSELEERLSNGTFKDRHVFFFNDMILCAKSGGGQGFFRSGGAAAFEFKWANPLSSLTMLESTLKDSDATRPYCIALNFQLEKTQERRVVAFSKEEEKNEWVEEMKKILEQDKAPSALGQPRKPSTGFFRTRPSDKGRVLSSQDRPRTIVLGGGTDPGTPGPSTPQYAGTPTSLTKTSSETKPKLPDIIRKMEKEKANIELIKKDLSDAVKRGKAKEKEEFLQKLADAQKNFEALQKEAQGISAKPRRLSAGNQVEALSSREAKTPTN